MITLDLRPSLAASPWMLAASVAFHGLLICAIIAFSGSMAIRKEPQKEVVTKLTLVEPVAGPLVAAKFEPSPVSPAESEHQEELVQPQPSVQPAEPSRQTVQAREALPAPSAKIPLKKRKTTPQRVADPPKKKPDKEKTEKKEDPKFVLETRLAELRKAVKTKKSEARGSTPTRENNDSRPAGALGTKPRGALLDEELARWFDGVRTRVNSRWAAFGEGSKPNRPTIIGVRVADDGKLVDATVDESSGDAIFDRSAMRAVFQAAPFPPVTPGIREKIQSAGGLALRFTAGGMQ